MIEPGCLILEAIDKIDERIPVEKEVFEHDELIQVWALHHIQIIGEATSQLSDEFRGNHPEIAWRTIAAMRNILVHAYFRVDLDEVWSVVKNDLPVLKRQIQLIVD